MTVTAFDRKVQRAAAAFIYLMLALGAYAWLAVNGLAPAAPWSPMGGSDLPAPPTPVVVVPDGYEPAVPVAPPAQDV